MVLRETEDSAVAHCELQHRRKKEPPPIEWLREQLAYDPETGKFKWKVTKPQRSDPIGCRRKTTGYLTIGVKYEGEAHRLFASRLAFALMEGRWPNIMDHINGDKSDDRWCNLREVTNAENMRNRPKNKNNKSGVTGVRWYKGSMKWRAEIRVEGKSLYLGSYDTKEEAIAARKEAEKLFGFHENHGREATEPSENN